MRKVAIDRVVPTSNERRLGEGTRRRRCRQRRDGRARIVGGPPSRGAGGVHAARLPRGQARPLASRGPRRPHPRGDRTPAAAGDRAGKEFFCSKIPLHICHLVTFLARRNC